MATAADRQRSRQQRSARPGSHAGHQVEGRDREVWVILINVPHDEIAMPIVPPLTVDRLPIPPAVLSFGEVTLRFVRVLPGEPARGFVPYFHFLVAAGGADVGHINFRIGNTEHVLVCAGHIGFEIAESFRGRGYALQACRAIAPFVRSVCNAVTITCDPDNLASRRTIERLGAEFVDEVAVPASDPHYQRGSRSKRRYRWTP